MIIVTKIPECTTHSLWCPEKDKEWIWDDQHDHGHQHARMHNSLPMISRAGQRMDMGWSAWSWSSTCQNAQLTHYDFQSRIKNGHEWSAWLQSPTCQNAQLTSYDFQSRTKNWHGMISMITVTNMPECTTHCLWFPEQDKEWTWNNQHDHSNRNSSMHNSLAMISRAGQGMDMGWSAWSQSMTCHNAQLTSYDCQSGKKNGHGSDHHARMHNSPSNIAQTGQRMHMG